MQPLSYQNIQCMLLMEAVVAFDNVNVVVIFYV
jgi:hypothetical protein